MCKGLHILEGMNEPDNSNDKNPADMVALMCIALMGVAYGFWIFDLLSSMA